LPAVTQTGTGGTIGGTISDPSGAAVPNVDITITNTDTNNATHIKSNDRGEYLVPDLPIGHYVVRAEAPGFKAVEQQNISLNIGERARVDLGLEVGSTQESVTVEANAVQVQSESGEVSSVITGQQMTQLATNGRSVYSLAALTPGASSNQPDLNVPTSAGGDASFSFNGLRQNHNLWMIDGGEASDRGGAGGIDAMPSIDAIGFASVQIWRKLGAL
jgi:Carboxypeptidase regulatory-like domain/TonB-dependent Receptor Plug Domain